MSGDDQARGESRDALDIRAAELRLECLRLANAVASYEIGATTTTPGGAEATVARARAYLAFVLGDATAGAAADG